jgi:hypothetical protein
VYEPPVLMDAVSENETSRLPKHTLPIFLTFLHFSLLYLLSPTLYPLSGSLFLSLSPIHPMRAVARWGRGGAARPGGSGCSGHVAWWVRAEGGGGCRRHNKVAGNTAGGRW